jgi:hypothetical protein
LEFAIFDLRIVIWISFSIANRNSQIAISSRLFHVDEFRLFIAQREAVTAETKLDGIAQRRAANHLHGGSVAKAHLQQPAAQILIAIHEDDRSAAADAQAIKPARFGRSTMIATG